MSTINSGQRASAQRSQRARGANGIIMTTTAQRQARLRPGHLRLRGHTNVMIRSANGDGISYGLIFRTNVHRGTRRLLRLISALRASFTQQGRLARANGLLLITTLRRRGQLRALRQLSECAFLCRLLVRVIGASFVRLISDRDGVRGTIDLTGRLDSSNGGLTIVSFCLRVRARAHRCAISRLRRLYLVGR